MVFLIDDLLADSAIGGLLASIATYVFSSAEVAAPMVEEGLLLTEEGTIAGEQSAIDEFANQARLTNPIFESQETKSLLINTFGADGLDAVVEIADEIPNNTRLPSYSYYEKMFDDVIASMSNGTMNKQSFSNSVCKLADSISKQVPRDTPGFKKLVTDVIKGAIANPKKVIGGAAAVVGGVAIAKGVYDQFKASYNGGKHLPRDLKKTVKDTISGVTKVATDTKKDVDDLIGLLPKGIDT